MAFKVYLSPSNQPLNTYNGVATNERDNCREIAKLLKTELERCGITVKLGLNGSKNISESNAFKPNLHIPIHTNAYNKKARGTSVMVYSTAAGNLKYATPIFNALKGIVLKQDSGRGISSRPDLAELNGTTAVAVYVEVDFHDVPEVAKWLTTQRKLIAQTIAKGICQGAGIKYVAEKPAELRATDSYDVNSENQPALAIYLAKLLFLKKGYSVDKNGFIGENTIKAIKDFQKKGGLAQTGILDADTAEAIVNQFTGK
ncbi:MAG: N-acetylmuramoyl-L-alanine amidase [Oscillospiraceae bacterium]|nr:N-acetylmuramoyl-L-alanine amidase [Candidatus Equicaccousia limihippi]